MGFLWRWPLAFLRWMFGNLLKLLLWLLASPALTLIWFAGLSYLWGVLHHPDWFVIGCISLLFVIIIRSAARSILNNWAVAAPKQPKPRKTKSKLQKSSNYPPQPIAAQSSHKATAPVSASVCVPKLRGQNVALRKLVNNLPDYLLAYLARSQHLHDSSAN